jgi:hypothetical protein
MSSGSFSPSIFGPSPPIPDGKALSMMLLENLESSLVLLAERGISSADEMTLQSFEKRLRTILNAPSPTSSTQGCFELGDGDPRSS